MTEDISGTPRGREAEHPSQIPPRGWLEILGRVWSETNADRIPLVAAGTAFFLLLALFPALAAFVSIYGFVANPITIADHIAFLGGLLPHEGLDIIRTQLDSLARQDPDSLSIGFLTGLGVSLWSVNSGVKSLFDALNVAYEEREKRGFFALTGLSFLFTLATMAVAGLLIASVGVLPILLETLNLAGHAELIVSLLRWPVLLMVIGASISVLYRFGPSREHAKWRWITWGSGFATLVWVAASIGFSWYLQNFANYNATYGSLGAIVGFMVWTWVSVMVLLVGAELNAEMERQTARDSTTGPAMPLGQRGAVVADTLPEG